MTMKQGSTPELSYSEVFKIDRGELGILSIVLTGDEVGLRIDSDSVHSTEFINVETAAEYCEHDTSDADWERGWEYGYDTAGQEETAVLEAIDSWHDYNHTGPARFCYLEPCYSVRAADKDSNRTLKRHGFDAAPV